SGVVAYTVASPAAELRDIGPVYAEIEKHALVEVAAYVLHDRVIVDALLPLLHPLGTELVHVDLPLRKSRLHPRRGFRICSGLLALGQSLQVLRPVLVRTKWRDLELGDEMRYPELPEREVEDRLVERVGRLQVEHGIDVRCPRRLPDRLDGAGSIRLQCGLGFLLPGAVELPIRRARGLLQVGLEQEKHLVSPPRDTSGPPLSGAAPLGGSRRRA